MCAVHRGVSACVCVCWIYVYDGFISLFGFSRFRCYYYENIQMHFGPSVRYIFFHFFSRLKPFLFRWFPQFNYDAIISYSYCRHHGYCNIKCERMWWMDAVFFFFSFVISFFFLSSTVSIPFRPLRFFFLLLLNNLICWDGFLGCDEMCSLKWFFLSFFFI